MYFRGLHYNKINCRRTNISCMNKMTIYNLKIHSSFLRHKTKFMFNHADVHS